MATTTESIRFLCLNCYSTIDAEQSLIQTKQICPHCKHPVKVPKTSLKYGELIDNYKILKFIGVGGMGEVYQASHIEDKKIVALKIIRPEVINKEEIDSFKKEIRMNLLVSHNNFVKAYEAGTDSQGRHYLALEFIRGRSLEDHIIKRGRFEENHGLTIALTVANALQSAWQSWQIIHRDIKPANILITSSNVVKIMDLGISTPVDENTKENLIIGTPYYISPEQIETPSKIDQRSDIYSLGATLFELLTGTEPFKGQDSTAILKNVLYEQPLDPQTIRPSLSHETCALIRKFMAKDRNDRPANWDEAIEALDAALNRHKHSDITNAESLDPSLIYSMSNDIKSYRGIIYSGLAGLITFVIFAVWAIVSNIP